MDTKYLALMSITSNQLNMSKISIYSEALQNSWKKKTENKFDLSQSVQF